jgi:hypothetical protein
MYKGAMKIKKLSPYSLYYFTPSKSGLLLPMPPADYDLTAIEIQKFIGSPLIRAATVNGIA